MAGRRLIMGLMAAATAVMVGCGPRAGVEAPKAEGPEAALAAVKAQLSTCAAEALGETTCADAAIAPATALVETALVEAASAVSPEGAQLIVQGQRQWLQSVRLECGLEGGGPEAMECLKAALAERAKEAEGAVEEKGGFTFQRVEVVKSTPLSAEAASASGLGEDAPAAITQELRFPRIDGAAGPQVEAFNRAMARMGEPRFKLEDQTNEELNYEITFASGDLISVRFDKYDYSLGAAHPNGAEEAVVILMRTGERLTPADMFAAPETRWKAFLSGRALKDLRGKLREIDPDIQLDPKDVADTATKVHNWLVTPEALVVLFPTYSIGPYALGPQQVTIPWADLKDLTRPDAPAPIRPAA